MGAFFFWIIDAGLTVSLHPQPLDIAPPGIGRNFQKDLSCKVSAVKLV